MAGRFSSLRFARALFELGVAGEKLDKLQAHLEVVAMLCRHHEVASFLASPRVSLNDKAGVLSRALGDGSSEVINLTCLLVKKRAVNRLVDVAAGYRRLMDERAGIERGHLTTALPLADADVRDMSVSLGSLLNYRTVVLAGKADPALLGGFQARVAGKLLDGSTRTALATLKKELS